MEVFLNSTTKVDKFASYVNFIQRAFNEASTMSAVAVTELLD